VPKNGLYAVKAKVPDSFKGQVVHISRLTDAHSYINSIGLVVPEMTSVVDQDGFITFPILNPTARDRVLPRMTPLCRYSFDMELRNSLPTDMQIEEIVDALHIEAADEKELAIRKEQVKDYIIASRAGYFSKDRLGRSCVGDFHIETPLVDRRRWAHAQPGQMRDRQGSCKVPGACCLQGWHPS